MDLQAITQTIKLGQGTTSSQHGCADSRARTRIRGADDTSKGPEDGGDSVEKITNSSLAKSNSNC